MSAAPYHAPCSHSPHLATQATQPVTPAKSLPEPVVAGAGGQRKVLAHRDSKNSVAYISYSESAQGWPPQGPHSLPPLPFRAQELAAGQPLTVETADQLPAAPAQSPPKVSETHRPGVL